ncbi:hypothetical protein [Methylobacterium oxalidis]|uniref:hypothetical protein n=1 Tax=Methylobacterium oxalidis TaxID=944322 RepID=UPI0033160659
MGAFFVRYKWLTAALVGVLTFAIAHGAWSRWITADPLGAPLIVSPSGQIERDVHVRLPCPHQLSLYLSSKTRTREDLRRLAGDYGATNGVDIPLRWSFRDATGRFVASGAAQNVGSDGFDAAGVYRAASEWLPLPPGRYQLDAALTGEVAGLEGVSIRLLFQCHPKNSSGWQDDVLIFGSLARFFAWPLAAGLALLLLGLAIWRRGRASATS